jgi:hypothetical protein
MQIHRAQHVVGVATKQRGRAHNIGRQNRPLANVGRQIRQVRAEVGAVHRQMFSHGVGHAQSLYLRSAFARGVPLASAAGANLARVCGVRWHSRKKKEAIPKLRAQAVETLRESPVRRNRSADQRAVIGRRIQNPKQGYKGLKPFKILVGPSVSRRIASPIIQICVGLLRALVGRRGRRVVHVATIVDALLEKFSFVLRGAFGAAGCRIAGLTRRELLLHKAVALLRHFGGDGAHAGRQQRGCSQQKSKGSRFCCKMRVHDKPPVPFAAIHCKFGPTNRVTVLQSTIRKNRAVAAL